MILKTVELSQKKLKNHLNFADNIVQSCQRLLFSGGNINMTPTDKDYSIIVALFTVVLTGEQNQLTLIKSKILISAFIVS